MRRTKWRSSPLGLLSHFLGATRNCKSSRKIGHRFDPWFSYGSPKSDLDMKMTWQPPERKQSGGTE